MTTRSSADRILSRLELFGTRLGLETTRSVLSALGDPHRTFSSVLVAGTNGKGSVAAMLAGIGTAAEYATGLFTSPHLETVNERIKLDGRSIEEPRLGELLETISETAQRVTGSPATYFESLLIASCCWFAQQEADLVIFEVGLGGRLDATNVNDPVLSVITEIALEHQEQLGDSIESIAREKAGIMRRGRPVVVGSRQRAALDQLELSASETGAIWHWASAGAEIGASREEPDWSQSMTVTTTGDQYKIRLLLAGEHQAQNLLTAVVAAEELAAAGWERIDRAAIESVLARRRTKLGEDFHFLFFENLDTPGPETGALAAALRAMAESPGAGRGGWKEADCPRCGSQSERRWSTRAIPRDTSRSLLFTLWCPGRQGCRRDAPALGEKSERCRTPASSFVSRSRPARSRFVGIGVRPPGGGRGSAPGPRCGD